MGPTVRQRTALIAALLALAVAGLAHAHGVASDDHAYVQTQKGSHFWLFFYLGAKHMVTGIDHLLFLAGVMFFLTRIKDVAVYVTLFALGHSATMIAGVLLQIEVNPYLVDAVIGLSVVYKALENLGGLKHLPGPAIDPRSAVFAFGLVHGLGLATRVQSFGLSQDGLVGNLLAFNLGVETGQLLALSAIVIAMGFWRRTSSFARHALAANAALMSAGFILIGMHLAGFVAGVPGR